MSSKRVWPTLTTSQTVPQDLGIYQTSTQIAGMLLAYLKLINAIKLSTPGREILIKSLVISAKAKRTVH